MLDTTSQLVALLDGAPDLKAAIGGDFSTRVGEVWNLPGGVTYPVLVVMPESTDAAPLAVSLLAEGLTVRMWFVTSGTMLEAISLRDALRAKLHLQQDALRASGLFVQEIRCVGSRVMMLHDIQRHQAYLEFRIVA